MQRLPVPDPGAFSLEMPNPKLTFICGPPYSGKQAVGQRLADELGQIHIAIDILQKNESKKDTEEGHMVAELLYLRKPVPSELRVRMLKKAFGSHPAPGYVITGFPITAEDAKLFEREIAEIKLIIFFDVWDYNRLLEKMPTENAKQALLARLEDYRKNSQEAINYYRELLKVKTIPCEVYEDEMLRKTRVEMKPQVYFLVGPPLAGKTTVARVLCDKYNLMYVGRPQGKSLAQTLTRAVEDGNSNRFLIDDFPQTAQELADFETLFGRSGSILVLRVNKDTLVERHPGLSLDIHTRYTRFQNQYREIRAKYQKLKPIHEISACGSLRQVMEQFEDLMEPRLVVVKGDAASGRSFREFLVQQSYFQVRPARLLASVCERRTAFGKELIRALELGKIFTVRQTARVISTLLYSGAEVRDKFVVEENYPVRQAEAKALEEECCKVATCFWMSVSAAQMPAEASGAESVETYMYERHKLVRVACKDEAGSAEQAPYFSEFIKEYVERKRGKAVFVIGPMLSGKTTVAAYIAKKHGYTLVDYAALPDQIKAKKSTEEEPYEADITWQDMQEELRFRLSDPNSKLVFDGLPPIDVVIPEAPASDEGEAGDKLPAFYAAMTSSPFFLDYPYSVIHLQPDGACLQKRLRKSLEVPAEEEVTEEQLTPLVQSQAYQSGFADYFDALSQQFIPRGVEDFRSGKVKGYYAVDSGRTLMTVQETLDGIFSRKIVLVDAEHEEVLKCVRNQALNCDFLLVDVTEAIAQAAISNTPLGQEISLLASLHHPPTLDHQLQAINNYIDRYLQFRSQTIVLVRFLSQFRVEGFPRTIDEFLALEAKVGTVIGCFTCSKDEGLLEIEVIPVVPPEEKKPEDEEEAQEEPQADEDGENKVEIITEEVEKPLRSGARPAVGVSKLFQQQKRDRPNFLIRKGPAARVVAEFFRKVGKYLLREQALSWKDEVRLQCPNTRFVL